jgi:nicotinamidase-related amidase
MRATFQNSGTAVSIGVFFSLMIAGLAGSLPHTLTSGLRHNGVPAHVATQVGGLPPVSSLFAAQLGVNPIKHLLQPGGTLAHLTRAQQQALTGREFFPNLISGPFYSGLVIVFAFGAALAFLAAIASVLRGTRPAASPSESRNNPAPTGEATMALTTIEPTAALVVIDLQKGIVSARTDDTVTAVVKQAAHLAAEFRRHGLPVVLVNVTGRAPGRTEAGRSRGGAVPPPGWADLIDELDVRPTDHLITKRRRSAFHDTGLDTLLRDLCVTQVVLAGIATSSGVESTARSASDHGYHVVLATDAMSDPDPEAHRHSIERVFPKLGETATTTEVIEKVEAAR